MITQMKAYCCISRGRFSWWGRVVTGEWQVQINSGWFTQRRQGWQAMRHVHVSHGEKHVVYISKTKKIKTKTKTKKTEKYSSEELINHQNQRKCRHYRMVLQLNLDSTQFWLFGFQRGQDLLLGRQYPSLGTGSVPYGGDTHPPAVLGDFSYP